MLLIIIIIGDSKPSLCYSVAGNVIEMHPLVVRELHTGEGIALIPTTNDIVTIRRVFLPHIYEIQ